MFDHCLAPGRKWRGLMKPICFISEFYFSFIYFVVHSYYLPVFFLSYSFIYLLFIYSLIIIYLLFIFAFYFYSFIFWGSCVVFLCVFFILKTIHNRDKEITFMYNFRWYPWQGWGEYRTYEYEYWKISTRVVLEYNVLSIFMLIILYKTSTRVVLAPALIHGLVQETHNSSALANSNGVTSCLH